MREKWIEIKAAAAEEAGLLKISWAQAKYWKVDQEIKQDVNGWRERKIKEWEDRRWHTRTVERPILTAWVNQHRKYPSIRRPADLTTRKWQLSFSNAITGFGDVMTKRVAIVFAAISSVLAASGSALAADMAVPPPLLATPAPFYNSWMGWYIGGNVGYSWGANASTNIQSLETTTTKLPNTPQIVNTFSFANSTPLGLKGVIGGGQIGYNYQINPRWVLGFETDIQASGERATNTLTSPFSGPFCANSFVGCPGGGVVTLNGVAVSSEEAKIEWFGTVRGRVGYLLNDGLLLYGTGGLAYGKISVSGNVDVSATAPAVASFPLGPIGPGTFGPTTSTFGQSKTNIGFAAGAGLEGRLASNWTWKLEYLFVDLGSLDTSTSFSAAASQQQTTFSPLTGPVTTHTRFTDNVVRIGLSYQFH